MQTDNDVKIDYLLAQGPEGLGKVLTDLLEKTRQDKKTGPAEYYLKYQLASQTSLIKVDLNAKPVQVWYYDLQGRPAPKIIKEKIAEVLPNSTFTDVNRSHQDQVFHSSIEPTYLVPAPVMEQRANKILAELHAPVISLAKSISSFFHQKTDKTTEPTPTPEKSPKKGF